MIAAREQAELSQTSPPTDPRADRLAGAPTTRRDALVAAGLAALVVAAGIIWRTPVVPTDPWHYVRSALEFPSDDWVPLGYTRYGIILANIPPAFVFKNSQASYYFWPLLSAAILAVVLYLIGRRFWGPVAGVVAVAVFFTNSIVFTNLSRGYPDMMSIALIFLAAYLALLARDRMVAGGRAVWLLLAVGFLLGWAFEVRETAMFAWPFVLVILWRRGQVLRTLAIVALPVLGWAALDVGISAFAYGDPLLKLHTLAPFAAEKIVDPSLPVEPVVHKDRLGHFLAIPQRALQTPGGLWMVVTGCVAAAAVLVRNWPLRLMSFSFISIYGLNVLAGGVLMPDRPFGTITVQRYWIQYMPSIALVVGGLAGLLTAWLVSRWRTTGWSTAAGAALVAAAVCAVPVLQVVSFASSSRALAPNGGDALENLREHLDAMDFRTAEVWTDWETKRILPAYQRDAFGGEKVWSGKPRSLTGGTPGPGDAVLLFSARDMTCQWCRNALQPWLEQHPTVPANWDLVYRSETGNVEFYEVR
jgi:Dolichyl-phosphate-mannose-protein mannosyltransferase